MRFMHVFVLSMLLMLVASCVAVEPPRFENGLYVNPNSQFTVSLPNGWEPTQELPDLLTKEESSFVRQQITTTFSDSKSNSFILVSAESLNDVDWSLVKQFSKDLAMHLEKGYANDKKIFLKDPSNRSYEYTVYKEQIDNCDSHCVVAKIGMHGGGLKGAGHNILYKSKYGHVYTVSMVFVAPEDQFANSLGAYEKVVDSFQRL